MRMLGKIRRMNSCHKQCDPEYNLGKVTTRQSKRKDNALWKKEWL
ncbi:hypothetical protein PBI_PEREGRIN_135 [Rhodococcus phage Peregrin]|nr:hypothetical protein PBI_PEREGRIN_135 [Rhodococcus phage Peregrin]